MSNTHQKNLKAVGQIAKAFGIVKSVPTIKTIDSRVRLAKALAALRKSSVAKAETDKSDSEKMMVVEAGKFKDAAENNKRPETVKKSIMKWNGEMSDPDPEGTANRVSQIRKAMLPRDHAKEYRENHCPSCLLPKTHGKPGRMCSC